MFNVGDRVTVHSQSDHSGEVVEVLFRIRADGVRGATHLHTAADLLPPPPPAPATGEELVQALQRKFNPDMVAELVTLISAGEITRHVLSQLTDIPLDRIPHNSPAAIVGDAPGVTHSPGPGSHPGMAPRETAAGELPEWTAP